MAMAPEHWASKDAPWMATGTHLTLATREERSRLELPIGGSVLRAVRVHTRHEVADIVEAITVPAQADPRQGAMQASTDARTLLARLETGLAEERLSIIPAPQWVADLLDIAAASPVLQIDRIVRSPLGRALEWRLTFSPSLPSGGGGGLWRRRRVHDG